MASRALSLITLTSPATLATVGPYTLGSNLALQISQCAVDVSAATVTSSGNSMQLTLPMVFLGAGTWAIEANLYNLSRTLTFKTLGTWTAPQISCSYAFAPASATAGMNDTAGTITVAADPGCPWLVSVDSAWIRITSAPSGVGGGTVSYAIAANATPAARNGTITIAGRTFSVSQSVTAGTRPAISANGVVNGASFQTGLAPATWITIQGANLAPVTLTWSASDFARDRLPTQLSGVSVGINGKPAYVYYISPAQINVLAPDDDSAGPVPVEVDTPDGRSVPITIQKQPLSPELFLFDQGGRKYAAAVYPDGTYVGTPNLIPGKTSRPAVPGEVILLFGTGFGPADPPSSAAALVSQPSVLRAPVTIRIGNVVANVAFAGLVGSGLYQFNVTVPNIPPGDQTVVIEIGGASSQGSASITVGK
jgi:uncharacterized protein (TIGR03437 family)